MASGRIVVAVLVIVLLLAVATVVLAGQRTGSPGETNSPVATPTLTSSTGTAPLKGVSFSPATYDSTGTSDFFSKARQAGEIVEWAGDWEQLGSGTGPSTVARLAAQDGMKAMVVVQFFTQSTGELLRPLNSSNEERYLAMTSSFVTEFKPAYLGVGIEVNVLYEKNVTNFDRFVSLYAAVYDEVKSASPETHVFTIFQLEKMNGLDGGLYGGTNDPSKAEWQLLALFPKSDVAAFTSYPGLVFQNPSDLPADYYSRIGSHTNKSIGFTEVGWHSGSVAGGWGSDEAEQAGFVSTFFRLSGGLARSFVVWSFLYDQNTVAPFDTMGLLYANGTAKQSWQAWLGGR